MLEGGGRGCHGCGGTRGNRDGIAQPEGGGGPDVHDCIAHDCMLMMRLHISPHDPICCAGPVPRPPWRTSSALSPDSKHGIRSY